MSFVRIKFALPPQPPLKRESLNVVPVLPAPLALDRQNDSRDAIPAPSTNHHINLGPQGNLDAVQNGDFATVMPVEERRVRQYSLSSHHIGRLSWTLMQFAFQPAIRVTTDASIAETDSESDSDDDYVPSYRNRRD